MKKKDVQGVSSETEAGSPLQPPRKASEDFRSAPHAPTDEELQAMREAEDEVNGEPPETDNRRSACCDATVKDEWDEAIGWICCTCTKCHAQYQDPRVPYYRLICTNKGEWIVTMLDQFILHRGDKVRALELWRALRAAYRADPAWAEKAMMEQLPKMVPVIDFPRVSDQSGATKERSVSDGTHAERGAHSDEQTPKKPK